MSVPPAAPGGQVYYAQPPPSYTEAVGAHMPPPPPGFKPPAGSGAGAGFVPPGGFVPPLVTHAHVGPEPMTLTCPNCGVNIESSTRAEPGLIAWISGVLIFLFGFWCGCCLIPCCIDSCMDVHHTCPNCKAYLGRYRR